MDALGQMAFGRAMQLGRDNRALAEAANAEIEKGNQTIRALKARVAELELALAVEKADAEGYKAMYVALKQQHPTSPLLADSGRRYANGSIKSKIVLMYEATFDRIFAAARIPGTKAMDHRAN